MTKTYNITLTSVEDSALAYAALSQQEWIENAIKERCRIAIEEIAKTCVEKCLETDTQIPGSKDSMVTLAFEKGWVKTSAEKQAESEAEQAALDAQRAQL